MKLTKEIDWECCRLKVEGEMTIYHAHELKDGLLEMLDQCTALDVNLAEVTEMDTCGAQILLMAKREAVRRARKLAYQEHSPATLEVIEILNLAGHYGDPLILSGKGGVQ